MSDPVKLSPEVRELYPWEGTYAEVGDGHRMHYLDVGEGPPVVMVHGNPTWSFYYRELIRDLSRDHRCIVPDHIGCGMSDKPADWGYGIADHVDNLALLLQQLDLEDATLVVHDWGGAIGYAAALRHLGTFRRFVVFNTAAFYLPLPFALRALRLPLYGPLMIRALNGFFPMGWKLATVQKQRFTAAVREGYLAPYGSYANRRAILRFIQEIPIEANHPTRALVGELEQGLPQLVKHPHLVCWGLKDPVFHPGYLAAWREWVPGGEFHEYEDAGHWVLDELPDRIVPLVREFLDRNEGGTE
jgi:cis-3-alkyl-4-acyloxetan-2-one decarboxylase